MSLDTLPEEESDLKVGHKMPIDIPSAELNIENDKYVIMDMVLLQLAQYI
jgi:hypothetical protein